MANANHEIQEAPELAALGTPDVASGDLPIGLRALIDEDMDEQTGMCSLHLLDAEGAKPSVVDASMSTTALLAALRSLA